MLTLNIPSLFPFRRLNFIDSEYIDFEQSAEKVVGSFRTDRITIENIIPHELEEFHWRRPKGDGRIKTTWIQSGPRVSVISLPGLVFLLTISANGATLGLLPLPLGGNVNAELSIVECAVAGAGRAGEAVGTLPTASTRAKKNVYYSS